MSIRILVVGYKKEKPKQVLYPKAIANTNWSHFHIGSHPIMEFWNTNVIIKLLVNYPQMGAGTMTYLLNLKWSSRKCFIRISKPLHTESVKYGIVV